MECEILSGNIFISCAANFSVDTLILMCYQKYNVRNFPRTIIPQQFHDFCMSKKIYQVEFLYGTHSDWITIRTNDKVYLNTDVKDMRKIVCIYNTERKLFTINGTNHYCDLMHPK